VASRAGTIQRLIADRLIDRVGDRVEDVITAPTRRLADMSVRAFPMIAVLLPTFSGVEPEGTHIRAEGTTRVEVLVYTRSDEEALDPEEASALLDSVSDALTGDFRMQIFSDESAFPLWKDAQGFEDSDGGLVRAVASFSMMVIETHTE
jgi:hypothetical protein